MPLFFLYLFPVKKDKRKSKGDGENKRWWVRKEKDDATTPITSHFLMVKKAKEYGEKKGRRKSRFSHIGSEPKIWERGDWEEKVPRRKKERKELSSRSPLQPQNGETE